MLARRTHWTQKLTAAATVIALGFSQTAPALAYGPNGAIAGYNDVRAIVDFRIPFGTSPSDKDGAPSFGFTVKRQFQFNDPIYETMSGSYRNAQHLTVNAMDLRFGMNGKVSALDIGGFNAFQGKTRLGASGDEDEGIPNWVWWVGIPVIIVGGVLIAVAASCGGDKCNFGGR